MHEATTRLDTSENTHNIACVRTKDQEHKIHVKTQCVCCVHHAF